MPRKKDEQDGLDFEPETAFRPDFGSVPEEAPKNNGKKSVVEPQIKQKVSMLEEETENLPDLNNNGQPQYPYQEDIAKPQSEALQFMFDKPVKDAEWLMSMTDLPEKMINALAMQETQEQATNPHRIKPLSQVWREKYARNRLNKNRASRTEAASLLQVAQEEKLDQEAANL